MRAEFEISGEENRPIARYKARALSPSFNRDCFSLVPVNFKALSLCPPADFQELGANKQKRGFIS
jgi:hypothetical protein